MFRQIPAFTRRSSSARAVFPTAKPRTQIDQKVAGKIPMQNIWIPDVDTPDQKSQHLILRLQDLKVKRSFGGENKR
jgi:hypothetical protein